MEPEIKVSPRILLQWPIARGRFQRALSLPKESQKWRLILETFKADGAKYAASDACGVMAWLGGHESLDGFPCLRNGRVEFWFYLSQIRPKLIDEAGTCRVRFRIYGHNVTVEADKNDEIMAALLELSAKMKVGAKGLGHGKYVYGCLYTDEKGEGEPKWGLKFIPSKRLGGKKNPAASSKKRLIGIVKAMSEEEASSLLEHMQGKKEAAPHTLTGPSAGGKDCKGAAPRTCIQSLFPDDGNELPESGGRMEVPRGALTRECRQVKPHATGPAQGSCPSPNGKGGLFERVTR